MTSRAAGYFEWRDALANARGVSLSLQGAMSIMATYATTESGGDVRPSLARVAARTGLSRSALSRHVADAVALGWLERVQDRSADGKPSVYRLTVPAGLDRGCPPARQEMSSGVTGVSQDGTGGVVDSDTTPSSTPDLTPSRTPTDTPSAGSCQHPDYCGDALCGLVDFMPPD